MSSYFPTIGLEVHAELSTKSKMFCGCANDPHKSQPNTHICPICLGHPGTLPVPNLTAIRSVLKFGVAVGGQLATYSEFDRKNYFYPDIPKAYQLSQYQYPFVSGGSIASVALTRVHLEEDTARSQHDKGLESIVDFNRAGVPLMELVTEPVIHEAKTAGNFARELQLLLRTLRISEANMEKGEMRVEANVSVSQTEVLGTKVEVKNLNSFKAVEAAIEYEVKRQVQTLEKGGALKQETRGWDENRNETYLQRSKETAKDYRYFPDPDIPKYNVATINDFSVKNLASELPELPQKKRVKYSYLGLTSSQIETIIQESTLDQYFSDCLYLIEDNEPKLARLVANYLLTDLSPRFENDVEHRLCPEQFVVLLREVQAKHVTSRVAKDIVTEFANNNQDLLSIIKSRNLGTTDAGAELMVIVKNTLNEHKNVVTDYKCGKETAIQFLIGQVMKKTRGKAEPQHVRELLLKQITTV